MDIRANRILGLTVDDTGVEPIVALELSAAPKSE